MSQANPTMRLEWAPGDPPTAEAPVFEDISDLLLEWDWGYGLNPNTLEYEAGTGSVFLRDKERLFDPGYTGNDTTNVVPNGGAEIDASGWANVFAGEGGPVRDTGQSKYGKASFKIITGTAPGRAGMVGGMGTINPPVGSVWTASMWVFANAGSVGKVFRIQLNEAGGGVFAEEGVGSNDYTLVAGWQRITTTGTVVRAGRTSLSLYGYFAASGSPTGTVIWVDGIQVENKSSATRYVETQGVARSRSAANIKPRRPFRMTALFPNWGNLVQNASFETGDLTGWTGGAGSVLVDFNNPDAVHPTGGGYRAYTSATTQVYRDSNLIEIDPSLPYTVSAYFRHWLGGINALSTVRIVCFDAAGANIGVIWPNQASPGLILSTPSHFDPPGFPLTRYGGTIFGQTGTNGNGFGGFMPGTKYVRVEIYWQYTATTFATAQGVVVDAVQLVQGTEAVPFFNEATYITPPPASSPLFLAHAKSYPQQTQFESDVRVRIDLADALALLQDVDLDAIGFDRPEELSSDRIEAVLDAADIPDSQRSIPQGKVLVGATSTTVDIGSALDQTKTVATDSESWPLYVTRAGQVAMQ